MRTLPRKNLDQREKDLLISQIRELFLVKESVLFAYIYGSFLREELFRDIDLAVYFDPTAFKGSDDILKYSLALSAECDLAMSGVICDLRPLNLAPLPFKFDVVTNGRIIYTRDAECQVDFEVRTRSLYFDFLPHLRFYFRRIVLGEPA
jgi:predicted nucleotidyltransferase